uniref:Uncharacterized protein n=1 Tax=Dicentrarchus labrax TaxID=13489 RepID=E6ZH46_DICLA|nr:Uncharacterized protein [Dicentrarchus labrax]
MIRMFMWPLQCLKGSSSELTLACSDLHRHLREGNSLRALGTGLRSSPKKKKKKTMTQSDPGVKITLAGSSRYVISSVSLQREQRRRCFLQLRRCTAAAKLVPTGRNVEWIPHKEAVYSSCIHSFAISNRSTSKYTVIYMHTKGVSMYVFNSENHCTSVQLKTDVCVRATDRFIFDRLFI